MLGKKSCKKCWIILILLVFLGLTSRAFAADASITVTGTETLVSGGWDTGSITISFSDSAGHSYSETAVYGQFSTSASIASTFGAKFSNDYYPSGLLCAHAVGGVIYFHLKGTASFEAPSISNPSISFTLTPSAAWPHLMIYGILPNPAIVGTTVTVTGTLFGSTQGSSTITFNGVAGAVTSWSTNAIIVVVPSGATTGDVVVTVNGSASNGYLFMVPTSCSH